MCIILPIFSECLASDFSVSVCVCEALVKVTLDLPLCAACGLIPPGVSAQIACSHKVCPKLPACLQCPWQGCGEASLVAICF